MPGKMDNQCVPLPKLIHELVKGLQDVRMRRRLGTGETICEKADPRTAETALK